MDALGTRLHAVLPGLSRERAARSISGYLFVGDVLLSESGMRDHPLTPMRDPILVRVLQRQTPRQGRAGAARRRAAAAPRPSRAAFAALRARRLSPRHRRRDRRPRSRGDRRGARPISPLITGGSGIALGPAGEFPPPPGCSATAAAPTRCRGSAAPRRCCRARARRRPWPRSPHMRERAPVFDDRPARGSPPTSDVARRRSPGRRRGSASGRS